MKARLSRLGVLLAGAVLALGIPGYAQMRPWAPVFPAFQNNPGVGSIFVYVNDQNDEVLHSKPTITLRIGSFHERVPSYPVYTGGAWVFHRIPTGYEYVVQVEAAGYETAQQFVNLPSVRGRLRRSPSA
jgi:hypothetical protein